MSADTSTKFYQPEQPNKESIKFEHEKLILSAKFLVTSGMFFSPWFIFFEPENNVFVSINHKN